MNWLLRLGLGSLTSSKPGEPFTAMSWDEVVESIEVEGPRAVEVAQRIGDAMLEYAVKHARRVNPLLLTGDKPAVVAFSAKIRTNFGYARLEQLRGPEECKVDSLGHAIAVGQEACRYGAKMLDALVGLRAAPILKQA